MSGGYSDNEASGNDWDDTFSPPSTSGPNRTSHFTFTWHSPWKKVDIFLRTSDGQKESISDDAACFQPIKLQYLMTNCLEKLQTLIYNKPFINVKSFKSGVELLEISLKSKPCPGIQTEIATVLSNEIEDVFLKMIPRQPYTCSIANELFETHMVNRNLTMVRDDLKVYIVGRSKFKDLICSTIKRFNELTSSTTISFDHTWKSVAINEFKIIQTLSLKFPDVLIREDDDSKKMLIQGRKTDVQTVVQELNAIITSLHVEYFPLDNLLSELLLCEEPALLLTLIFKKLQTDVLWTVENDDLWVVGKEGISKDDVKWMLSQTFVQVGFDSSSDKHFCNSKAFNDTIKKHINTTLVLKTNKRGVSVASTKEVIRLLLQQEYQYTTSNEKSVQVGMASSARQLPTPIRIVLIGKTGVGKSKVGNVILNKPHYFSYGGGGSSVTALCTMGIAYRFGTQLQVVDTPGVFNTHASNEEIQDEIKRCIGMTSPGPHAFLLCVKMGKFDKTDCQVLDHFLRYFGPELLKFVIVVFTYLDLWEADQEERKIPQTKEEYVAHVNPELSIFMKRCSNRYVFFNSRLMEAERQIQEILEKVKEILVDNVNAFYTMNAYKKVNNIPEEEQTFMGKFKKTTLSLFNK